MAIITAVICRYAHIMRCHNIRMTKVAVVTGSSSGIGYETSLLLVRNQITTYATTRNIRKSDRLREIVLKENIPLNVIRCKQRLIGK